VLRWLAQHFPVPWQVLAAVGGFGLVLGLAVALQDRSGTPLLAGFLSAALWWSLAWVKRLADVNAKADVAGDAPLPGDS
jgi:NaMN:DMB phosphoribosyltransferase